MEFPLSFPPSSGAGVDFGVRASLLGLSEEFLYPQNALLGRERVLLFSPLVPLVVPNAAFHYESVPEWHTSAESVESVVSKQMRQLPHDVEFVPPAVLATHLQGEVRFQRDRAIFMPSSGNALALAAGSNSRDCILLHLGMKDQCKSKGGTAGAAKEARQANVCLRWCSPLQTREGSHLSIGAPVVTVNGVCGDNVRQLQMGGATTDGQATMGAIRTANRCHFFPLMDSSELRKASVLHTFTS